MIQFQYNNQQYDVEIAEDGLQDFSMRVNGMLICVDNEMTDIYRDGDGHLGDAELHDLAVAAIDAGVTEELYDTEAASEAEGFSRGRTDDQAQPKDSETVGQPREPSDNRINLKPSVKIGSEQGGQQKDTEGINSKSIPGGS